MITPTKYLNLDYSVINVSANIIKILKTNGIMEYKEVLNVLIEKIGKDVKIMFVPALNFLYLVGKLEYHSSSDSLEFINKVETKEIL